MMGPREVLPEILDELSPDDPRAVASREDLRRMNGLMGNARHMARLLSGRAMRRVLEIGAGSGDSMLLVARRLRLPLFTTVGWETGDFADTLRLTLLDRQNLLTEPRRAAYARLGWLAEAVQADAFDYLRRETERFDAVVANLFLHHFEDAPLRELLALVAERTNLFAACEPARSALSVASCRFLGLLGCNEVTRHDARVSVRAGFRGQEISALWPASGEWRIEERFAPPFSHVFRAVRR